MEWNQFDKFIGELRYRKVKQYVKTGERVVDIGCGREGAFLRHIANRVANGYGFDYRINNHVEGNLSFICNKDMDSLPLASESIDRVFMNAVLEHLVDAETMMKECVRILKPGGEIVLTTPTPLAKPLLEFMAYKIHVINEDEIREHKHYWTKSDIVKLCETLGGGISLVSYQFFELFMNSLIVLKKGG